MAATLSIRPMTPADIGTVAQLHLDTWRHAYRDVYPLDAMTLAEFAGRWQRAFASPSHKFCCLHDDLIVGLLSVHLNADAAEILTLYVSPKAQGMGCGTALLNHGLRLASQSGYGTAALWVLADNRPAIDFYRRRGWQEDGRVATVERYGCARQQIGMARTLSN
ncbi:GNAT family N-acetyltransferase [Chitinimonas lacunae]|uniref:GNAT family N-acetyltransferase n=1 Tax=Chitinimonas lacunae TaxID=1963018 RepID=A0ABV8MPX1_9NEIS